MNFSITHDYLIWMLKMFESSQLCPDAHCFQTPFFLVKIHNLLYLDHNPTHGHFTCFALNDRDCWEKGTVPIYDAKYAHHILSGGQL